MAGRLAYHFERGEVYEKAAAYLEAARTAAPPMVVAGARDASEVPMHRRRRITEAAVPLPDKAWSTIDEALRAITQASKALWMYPADSPIAQAASRDLHQTLAEVLEHAEVVSLAAVEGRLLLCTTDGQLQCFVGKE